jgi:GT2 family glycosyltransferase
MSRSGRVLVVIPVYGHEDVTRALIADLRRERRLVDVVVVDNRGDYEGTGWEAVVRPGENLGWAAGTDRGTELHLGPQHAGVLWLNNDTRLSRRFVRRLRRAARDTGAAVVAPVYDCHWLHQHVGVWPEARRYRGRREHLRAPFVDGTAMYVPRWAVERLGLLEAEAFAPLGWGAEIDYCLRARAAGLEVAITRAAFLHHERAVTAQTVFEDYETYVGEAYPAALAGLVARWGEGWEERAELDPESRQVGRLQDLPRLPRRAR